MTVANDGIWDWHLDTNNVYFDARYYTMAGYVADEFPASFNAWMQRVHPDDLEQARIAIDEYLAGERDSYDIEFRFRRKDDGYIWIRARGQIVARDKSGKPLRFVGTHADISDRKQAELALRENEQRLSRILNTLPYGVQENDIHGIITYSNPAHHRILGVPNGQLIGRHIWDFLPDNDARQEMRDYLACLLAEQPAPEPFIARNLNIGGKDLILEIKWDYIRDAGGAVCGFTSIISDITARVRAETSLKQNEAGLAEAQRIARLGSWELDLLTNELHWSDEIFRIFEIDPEQFGASYEGFLELVHPDDRDLVNTAYTESLATRKPYDLVHRLCFPDGRTKFVHERCETLYDKRGKALLSRGTVQDITERYEAEQGLHYRLALEAALARASSQLAAASDEALDGAIKQVLEHIGTVLKADRSYLCRIDVTDRRFSNTHEWCAAGIDARQTMLQKIPAVDFAAIFEHFAAGRILNVGEPGELTAELAPLKKFMQDTGICSLINVPLQSENRLWGIIGFDSVQGPRHWPEEDVRVLQTVAEIISGALARRAASGQIRDHNWYLENLDRATKVLSAKLHTSEILRQLTEVILDIFDVDRAWLVSLSDPRAPAYPIPIEATRAEYPGAFSDGAEIPGDDFLDRIVQHVLSGNEPLLMQMDEIDNVPEYIKQYQVRSQMLVALHPQVGDPWLLGVHQCARKRHWTALEQRLFQTIAERVSITLSDSMLLQQMRESERRLQEAERIAHLGNWKLDLKSGEAIWSDEEYRVLGYATGEVAANIDNFMRAVHPDDRQRVEAEMQRAMLDGEEALYHITHRVVGSDGQERVVEERGEVIFDRQGQPAQIFGTTQDVTERVRTEAELNRHRQHLEQLVEERTATIRQQAQIIDQSHEAVVTTDLDGCINSWNRGAEQLFGVTAAQAMNQHISFVYPTDQHEFLEQQVLAPLKEKASLDVEVQLLRANGSEFPAHLSLSMLYDETGSPKGMVGFAIDISELKQREQELRLLADRLQVTNQELESFSYSVSHDLRSPLRAIDGFSQALVEDYGEQLDATALDYLQRLRNGAQRMGRLIDDLLKLSRVNRGELKKQEVDLAEIARTVTRELRGAEPEREVQVTLQSDLQIRGDPQLLRIMLDNLLGNAWKFTNREPQAQIEFGRLADEPEVFYVRDNGVGFDMRHADKLFGAFQRLHRITDFPGTGIGLATVQRIVHRHGGKVWAESRPGAGATFYFSFGADAYPARFHNLARSQ